MLIDKLWKIVSQLFWKQSESTLKAEAMVRVNIIGLFSSGYIN